MKGQVGRQVREERPATRVGSGLGNRGAGGLEALLWAVNMEQGEDKHAEDRRRRPKGCKGSICSDEVVLGRSGSERPSCWTERRAPTWTTDTQPSP